jgi:hypothetical protein
LRDTEVLQLFVLGDGVGEGLEPRRADSVVGNVEVAKDVFRVGKPLD